MLHPATCSYKQQQGQTMSSNIRLLKSCSYCGKDFIAKTTVTLHCSDDCAKRSYKKRKRDEKLIKAKSEVAQSIPVPAMEKQFLSIRETCLLLGISRWTLYRLIQSNRLAVFKAGKRIVIQRASIYNLFNSNQL